MQEWLDKYRDVPRMETNASIDKPMIIFLGLTLSDFITGVSTFLIVELMWDSGFSIPCAVFGALASTLCSKYYRNTFPPMFLSHLNWTLGIQNFKHMPSLFKKRRYRAFGP